MTTMMMLQSEMIAAMKAKNKLRKDTIANLIAAIKKAGIDAGCRDNIPDEMVNTVLIKEQKTAQEMIDTCPADRAETLAEYIQKMEIIKEFAPQLLTNPDEIRGFILAEAYKANIPLEMKSRGALMKLLKGKVDMKIANTVLEKLIKGEF